MTQKLYVSSKKVMRFSRDWDGIRSDIAGSASDEQLTLGPAQNRPSPRPIPFCYPPPMDHLWTPWRYAYVTGAEPKSGCIFCNAPKESDQQARIVHRGAHCYIILNTYPYTPGHVMIVPYAHLDELQKLPGEAAQEMMTLTQRMETVLRHLYKPDGINLGMNIGKAAGAGVAGHIHMHILPRWVADANFVSVIGETRVLPEALDVTWERIRKELAN
jgi:ATP adenylyltransferase